MIVSIFHLITAIWSLVTVPKVKEIQGICLHLDPFVVYSDATSRQSLQQDPYDTLWL